MSAKPTSDSLLHGTKGFSPAPLLDNNDVLVSDKFDERVVAIVVIPQQHPQPLTGRGGGYQGVVGLSEYNSTALKGIAYVKVCRCAV
jgi:hypothetical protein